MWKANVKNRHPANLHGFVGFMVVRGAHIESVYEEKGSLDLQPPPALFSQCGSAAVFQ